MPPTDGPLNAVVRASLERWGVPGAVAGTLVDGTMDVRAYGVADLRTGAALDGDATLRIASITKPFTAALALALADEGLLHLDEAVPVPLPADGVTTRHLLAHLGGFEGELGDVARFGDGDDALARLASELRGLTQLVPPGRYWSYCNAGYWAVAALCAERAGTTYEDALRRRVLEPLGLRRTSFAEPEVAGHEQPEYGVPLHEPVPAAAYPRARRPSGGLVSTAADLLRFAEAHLGERPPARLTPPEAETPSGAYALGWAVEEVGGVSIWSHDGAYGGFRSRLALVPERRTALAILTNGDAGEAVVREVADWILDSVCGLRRTEPATVELGDDELVVLAGRYAGIELDARVAHRDGALVVNAVETDVRTGERRELPTTRARPIGGRRFAVVGGQWHDVRFDVVPETGAPEFLRLGGRLLPRT